MSGSTRDDSPRKNSHHILPRLASGYFQECYSETQERLARLRGPEGQWTALGIGNEPIEGASDTRYSSVQHGGGRSKGEFMTITGRFSAAC